MKRILRSTLLIALMAFTFMVSACAKPEAHEPEYTDAESELIAKLEEDATPLAVFERAADVNDYLHSKAFTSALKAAEAAVESASGEDTEDPSAKAAADALAAINSRKAGLEEYRDGLLSTLAKPTNGKTDEVDHDGFEEVEKAFHKRIGGPFYKLMRDRHNSIYGLFKGDATNEQIDLEAIQVVRDEISEGDATTKESYKDAIARTMNESIVEFNAIWGQAEVLKGPVEQVITDFVVFKTGSDLRQIQGFAPVVDEAERAKLMEEIFWFACRFPDGQVAKWVKGYQEAPDDVKDKDEQRNPLRHIGEPEAAESPERELAQGVVEDLILVFGKELEPTASFRKGLVRQFSEEANLLYPNPRALILAIFGSVVLFGGLAFSIFRAVQGGRREKLPPSSEA